jgi:lipopolysaccharide export system permease protein
MMLLDRYIGRSIMAATFVALVVLLALDFLLVFINESQDVGKGRYDLTGAFLYVIFTLPGRAFEMAPVAALLGALLGLGALSVNSELTGMRAAGVSLGRIVRSVMNTGIVMLAVIVVLGEWVMPHTNLHAEETRKFLQTESTGFKSRYGFWARDGDTFVNLREIHPDGRFGGVSIYWLDDALELHSIIEAEQAYLADGGGWVLSDVKDSKIFRDHLAVNRHAVLELPSPISPDLLDLVMVDARNLPVRDLYRYVGYLEANNLDAIPYRLEVWRRLAVPLSTMVMLMLAIPFVFGPLRSTRTGQRLFAGVMIGVGYFLLERTLSHAGQVYGLSPAMGGLATPALFSATTILLFRRIN